MSSLHPIQPLRVAPKRISKNPRPLVCPPDKSITHRSFLFSLLSSGTSRIERPLFGEDCLASLEAVRRLGAAVKRENDFVEITGFGIKNFGLKKTSRDNPLKIDCQNSGTTIRLLSGLLSGQDGFFHLTGDPSLSQRPMARVSKPLMQMGAAIFPRGKKQGASSEIPTPPVDIEPVPSQGLRALNYEMNIASAQVKSAVLLAGLFCKAGTTSVTEPSLSRDHTERMLRVMGVDVRAEVLDDLKARASVEGCFGRDLNPLQMLVGGDPSSAAFWACAAVMQGRRVRIDDVLMNPTRTGFAEVLKRMGAQVSHHWTRDEGGEKLGSIEVQAESIQGLRATEVLPPEIPTLVDEVPMLAITALWASGTTVFRGVQELRVKESDRLEAVIHFIKSIGGSAWAEGDDLFVEGLGGPPPGPSSAQWYYETLGDHRLAMAAVVTADALQREIVLDDADCIKVSYPGFFDHRELISKDFRA